MSLNIKYSTGKGKLVKNRSASVLNFCIVSTTYSLLFQSRLITKTANIKEKKGTHTTKKVNNSMNF